MIEVNNTILVIRNARDKVQVVDLHLMQDGMNYVIQRITGQFQGVMQEQPEIRIEKGKSKRSVLQQAELEYNSKMKGYLDKGYKKLTDLTKTKYAVITSEELDRIVPTIKTDQEGNSKPQLAKSSNDCTLNVWNKPMLCSRKIDGVRNLFRYNPETEEIISISRGGGNYNVATTHLRNNETLLNFFKENPDIILDGELYHHGWSLQEISGTCRLKTWEDRCEHIEYWIYDIADDTKTAQERVEFLETLEEVFENESKFTILEHYELTGWEEVKRYHDKFVKEGFEGLVARKPDKKYQFGKRNSDWIKLKCYLDAEFEITGISDGLRPEDMCFTLITDDRKPFKAKPIGDRWLKDYYLNNWESFVGKKATVKFFAWSNEGIPTQPVFKSIREDGE